jgi:CRP-like cAMP-binding protein
VRGEVELLKNTDHDIESLFKYKTRHFYKENSVIYREGSYGNHFYFIKEGLIKIITTTSKGNEKILNIGYPGQFIGMPAFNQKHLTTAIAIKNSVLYCFCFDNINELISSNPEFLNIITDSFRHNTSVLLKNLYIDTMDAKQRLSYLILLYVNDFENDRIALTISDFAKYTGLTRMRVYQILKEWETKGIISIQGKHFYVLNLNYIENIVNSTT